MIHRKETMENDGEVLEGTIKEVVFSNEENGYQVLRFQAGDDAGSLVTIVGSLNGLMPGEMLRLSGNWAQHKTFGRQFQVKDYSFLTPRSVSGLVRYLGSGMIKGVGPVIAARIVKRFGLAALEIMDNHPGRLLEVDGIGKKKSEKILQSWNKQRALREMMIFLKSYDISTAYAVRICRQYGKETIRVVKENPYVLARDVRGVGFRIADRIAAKLGMSRVCEERIAAAIVYMLEEAVEEGHIFLPERELVSGTAELLEMEEAKVGPVLERMGAKGVLVEEDGRVYLPALHQVEGRVARDLLRLGGNRQGKMELSRAMERLAGIEQSSVVHFSAEQKQAIVRAFTSGILVLTGGPGTGKTTTVSGIIAVCEAEKLKFVLAAPTGRAAKRMSESTGKPAKTIHRLLEYSPRGGAFGRDENRPLGADVVIIDEASMLDVFLAAGLLRALADGTTLILVGDSNQLPAVGAGSVLWDVIDSGRFAVVKLSQIFRQARTSQIITNAHLINRGIIPKIGNDPGDDFFFLIEEEPAAAAAVIRDLVERRLPEKFGWNPMIDIQLLSPMYRGDLGVHNLNLLLQESLNSDGERLAGGRFRLHDKVMQIKNNYEKNVFNGDIGVIESADGEKKNLTVKFEGQRVNYEYDELEQLVPAYCISVHKSQGSEYPVVVMPVSTQHYVMLQRNLLYTGITRARKMVVLVGTRKALAIAVRNDRMVRRHTSLVARLQEKR